ncbi:metallophosphoesterase [Brevibacillus fortis]|uniref:Metallophosphoesterase n=1 Tax=Brevibacillus fortis TaxID=2126352 RepID=A0A2P7VK46_9BACL|nr:metallophosphoesterase [Brevibacillus fortis]PSJ99544.1 metallophosphoesterase [Brevibacillus fortis]
MLIQTQVHTIFMLVGPTECGKTTFAKEVLMPKLSFQDEPKNVTANVQYISSDSIRQELLGHEYDKYDQVMLEASEQAFQLLFEKLRLVTSFPINAEFVVVDTTGLAEDFRSKVRDIAAENNYRLEVILFDYRNREDYYASERSKKLITGHILRLKQEVLRSLSKEGYHTIHRIRHKDFYTLADEVANPRYEVVIENKEAYLATILPKDQTYIIIGDIHECVHELKGLLQNYGFKLEDNRLISTDKVQHTKIIVAGDWIDKGAQTREIIEFLYENQQFFLFVRGNHENFVYKYLRKELKGVDPKLLGDYFDSIQVLEKDAELTEMFHHLYTLAQPFYRSNALTGPSYYVTHAPCKKKYLGKLDTNSVRRQRNFRIDRTASLEEQLAFLTVEAVSNHPYHIFGHIAAQKTFRLKNKLHLDTGCVHGNSLTSVVISHKPFFKSVPSEHRVMTEELPILFQAEKQVSIGDLEEEELQRLRYCSQNKVNFISGTMPPADKDGATQELESLKAGLDYFANRGIHQVVLQPKYMGSRCNLYLHHDRDKCFAISRNGYAINQIDLTPIYDKLHARFREYMEQNEIAMLILDGELLPWSAIGKGLIEKQFKPIESALRSEFAFLQENGFEEALHQLVQQYDESGFEKDQFHLSKSALTEKFGSSLYQNYKYLREIKESYVPVDKHVEAYHIYQKQIELYAGEGELVYKPFSILKAVYLNGDEQLPDWKTSDMYRFVNDDHFLALDLSESNAYEQAAGYFSTITLENKMEGIVIKPEYIDQKVVPAMKVRNPEYLSIIYGYDYRFPHKYRKLFNQKNISKKLKTSMQEHRLGERMLGFKFDDISPENTEYQKVVATMLFEVAKEKEIDPRL